MDFYKQFLQSKGTPVASKPGMHLTIFGKHPGWDDHIPEVGTTTETLSILKRDFYVRGIGGLIDAGAWDKLNEEDVLDGFNHLFFAQRGREGIVGRMWASTDGKGRARYPMVVAIHTVNIPLHRCLKEVLWQLEKFREDCISRTREREIIQIVKSEQEKLNQMAEELGSDPPDNLEYAEFVQRMLSAENLDDTARHSRLLYEIKNKLEPFSPANNEKFVPEETVPGEHIRLPYSGEIDESDAFIGWLTYLRTQISPRIPIILLKPVAEQWMDAIIGHLDGKQLLCLRSSLHHSPPATELKYNIPSEFTDSVQKQLTAIADWKQFPHENSLFEGTVKRRVLEPKIKSNDPEDGGFFSKPKNLIISGIAVLIILVVIVVLAMSMGSSETDSKAEAVESTTVEQATQSSNKTINGNPSQALAYLSEAESLWYPRLFRYIRNQSVKEAWSKNEDLGKLLGFLESQELRALLQQVGAVSNVKVEDLAMMDAANRDAIVQLATSIHKIEDDLDNWQVSQDLDFVRTFVADLDLPKVMKELDQLAPALNFNERLGEQIQQRLEAASLLDQLSLAARQYVETLESVSGSELAVLSNVPGWCEKRIKASASAQALIDNLTILQRDLDALSVVLQDSRIPDRASLVADERYGVIATATAEQFDQLIALIKDYQQIDRDSLPEMNIADVFPKTELEENLKVIQGLDDGFSSESYLSRWEAIDAELKKVGAIPSISKNLDQIRDRARDAYVKIDALQLDLGKALAERSDPSGWYAALAQMKFGDAAFNESWKGRVVESVPESLIPQLTDDNAAFISKRQEMEAWRSLFEETLQFAESLKYPSLEQGSSGTALARNKWISEFHEMLVSESLSGFLDELAKPIDESVASWAPTLEWKGQFEQRITSHYQQLEADLTLLEKDLLDKGNGDYSGLKDRIEQAWPSVEPGANIGNLLAGLQELEIARQDASPSNLLNSISGSDWPGVRWAAWRGMLGLDEWPVAAADLDLISRAGSLLLESGLTESELVSELTAAWRKAMLATTDRMQRVDLWQFHEQSNWPADELSEVWKYDRLISTNLDKELLRKDRDTVVRLRDAMIERIRSIESISSSNDVVGFLRELELIQFEDGKTIDQELLADAGPGAVGWKLAEVDPLGKWVVYTWRSGNLRFDEGIDDYRLAFVLVEPFNQERFYLGADEISVGAFFDWISESVGWDNFSHNLPDGAFGSDSLQNDIAWRSGPRAWTLGTDSELYVARDWQIQNNTQEVPVEKDRDRRPSRFSPANYITPNTASVWAATVNCRLPSPKEFTGLSSSVGVDGNESNLRDTTWVRHLKFVQQQLGAMNTSWPDNDCFIPESMTVKRRSDAEPATLEDDGVLWFKNVGNETTAPVQVSNLKGNIAEYVFDSKSDAYFVVGASSLSPPEVVWNAPYGLEQASSTGYSDVGLRLAFNAPTPLPGRILLDALGTAPQISLADE